MVIAWLQLCTDHPGASAGRNMYGCFQLPTWSLEDIAVPSMGHLPDNRSMGHPSQKQITIKLIGVCGLDGPSLTVEGSTGLPS